MKSILTITMIWLTLTASLAIAQDAEENSYVSSNGKFLINYPADWEQVDYVTVDYFLINSQASQEALKYEAVFSIKDSLPFHEGPYLIITLDTVGKQSQAQIDTLLTQLSETFGEGIKYYPTGDYMSDLESQAPNWDKEKQQITIRTDITEQYKIVKRNLWVMQFYDRGILNYYFFSPDSVFEQNLPLFQNIVSSFSTENIEAAMPKQKYKLADIEDSPDLSEDSKSIGIFGLPISIVIVLIIVIARRRRRNKKQS